MAVNFETTLSAIAAKVEDALNRLLPPIAGNRLQEAMRYATLGQGKRLRPFFVMESCKLHGVAEARALNVAAALEMIHCYSLAHDDLPAMDNDDLRRGQPTTHKKFDEATAILAGDGLLTFAFQILAEAGESPALIAALAKAAGPAGMVSGQMVDMQSLTTGFASFDKISAMQQAKTGALFEFACISGPLMAGADASALRSYANHIGLAFQIADDILDVESSAETLGKATQKDKAKGKKTFVDFMGLDGAKQQAAGLVAEAKSALVTYGEKADVLRQAAEFMISRRK
ncbi:MAG: polyprenyl synthetase family protein [Aestuariivirga sp.]